MNFYCPEQFGRNCKGMSASVPLSGTRNWLAKCVWNGTIRINRISAWMLSKLDVHKQWSNRPLDWCSYIEVLATAVEQEWWDFIMLREHPAAQPEMQELARHIRVSITNSKPINIKPSYYYSASEVKLDSMSVDDWHIPFKDSYLQHVTDLTTHQKLKIATARAARLSYLTHEGKYDPEADYKLHDRLQYEKHWSPFEHCAFPIVGCKRSRNYIGWVQYRALVDGRGIYSN